MTELGCAIDEPASDMLRAVLKRLGVPEPHCPPCNHRTAEDAIHCDKCKDFDYSKPVFSDAFLQYMWMSVYVEDGDSIEGFIDDVADHMAFVRDEQHRLDSEASSDSDPSSDDE